MRGVPFLMLSQLPQGCHHPQEQYTCVWLVCSCSAWKSGTQKKEETLQYLILLWEEPREPDFITAALACLGSICSFFATSHMMQFTGDSPLQAILSLQKSVKLYKPGACCESMLIYKSLENVSALLVRCYL